MVLLGYIVILLLCIAIGFCILVVMGNLSAMKFLAKNGVAVFSHKIETDCKLLNYVNKEGAGWLKIPDVCYSPIMENCDGKYKNHNFLQKSNMYGEIYLSDSKKAMHLSEFSLDKGKDMKIKDLTIIKGKPFGNGTDLRHANFSLLRKMQHGIKDNTDILICEEGVTRHFMPIAMIEMGIDENRPIAYNNREEFLKSFLELADIKTTTKVPKDSVVLLECRTDIDLVMVLLVENKSGRKVRQI
jgi:hypothetical protein